jgi:hypothetical protein
MKFLILSLLLAASSSSAFAMSEVPAGLKFFANYNPETKKYDSVKEASEAAPISAEVLLNETTAVCFSGRIFGVKGLLSQMVEIYNAESNEDGIVLTNFEAVPNGKNFNQDVVKFEIKRLYQDGVETMTWGRVRRCI